MVGTMPATVFPAGGSEALNVEGHAAAMSKCGWSTKTVEVWDGLLVKGSLETGPVVTLCLCIASARGGLVAGAVDDCTTPYVHASPCRRQSLHIGLTSSHLTLLSLQVLQPVRVRSRLPMVVIRPIRRSRTQIEG